MKELKKERNNFPKLHNVNWAVNKVVKSVTQTNIKRKPMVPVPITAKSNTTKTKRVIDKMKGRTKRYKRMTPGEIDDALLTSLRRIRMEQAKMEPKRYKKVTKPKPPKYPLQKQLKYRQIVEAAKQRVRK